MNIVKALQFLLRCKVYVSERQIENKNVKEIAVGEASWKMLSRTSL